MKKIILVMGLLMLLLTSSVMAAGNNNRFPNINELSPNELEEVHQTTTQEQTTKELRAKTNQANIPEKIYLLQEQMQIGERIQIKQQEKLFGLFNVERTIAYEKTAIGPQRVSKIFDFLFK